MYRFSRVPLPVICAAALLWSGTQIAQAHPFLIGANPAPETILSSAPAEVQLLFSENLNGDASHIVVWNRDHHKVDNGTASLVAGNPRQLDVRLSRLGPGSYLVLWTVVSAEDGHLVRGSYLFSVKKRDPAFPLQGSTAGNDSQGFPSTETLSSLVAHWISLMAAVTWIGSALFFALMSSSRSALSVEARRLNATVAVSATVLLGMNCVTVVTQAHLLAGDRWGSTFSPSVFSTLFADQYGQLWIVRQLIVLLALSTCFGVPTKRSVPAWLSPAVLQGRSWHVGPWAPAVLGLLYLYAFAASGHAASSDVGALSGNHLFSAAVLMDWLHLLGVALWLGGQVCIVLVLIPATLCRPLVGPGWQDDTRVLLDSLRRFSPFAYAGIALLALTGSFNGAIHVPSWSAFFDSVYGHALVTKLGLIAIMFGVSFYTVYYLRPRIRRLLAAGDASVRSAAAPWVRQLRAWLHVNPILGAGVLLAVAVMFYYPVPSGVSSSPVQAAVPPILIQSTPTPTPAPRSTRSGHTHVSDPWQSAGLSGILVYDLALGHTHSTLAFAGTIRGIYRRDKGRSWQPVFRDTTVPSVTLLSNDKTVIAGDAAGYILTSSDAGKRWHKKRISRGGIFAVAIEPGNERRMVAGAEDGLYLTVDGGRHWKRRLQLKHVFVSGLFWQPDGSHLIFAATSVSDRNGGPTGILVSRDSGKTWRGFGSHLVDQGAVMSVIATPHHVFAGTMGNGVWRAPFTTKSWSKMQNGMPTFNDHGGALLTLPKKTSTIFAGTLGYGVFRSIDAGEHWKDISAGLPPSRLANIVLSLKYSARQRALYAGTDDGVYELAPL